VANGLLDDSPQTSVNSFAVYLLIKRGQLDSIEALREQIPTGVLSET
jgi:hypothetical protein